MKTAKIKILLVIPSLRAGGAERVMSFIATGLNRTQFEPVLVITGFSDDVRYEISGVPVKFLEKKRVSHSLFSLARTLRSESPAIVMGSIGHVNILLAVLSLFFPNVSFIGRETLVASQDPDRKKFKNRLLHYLFQFLPRFLDAVVAQSEDMKTDLVEHYDVPPKKLFLINNPVTSAFQLKKRHSNKATRFITVGRLAPQKGHHRLLKILSQFKYDFHYTIVGSGPLARELKAYAGELGLEEKITWIPFSNDIPSLLANSDLYLQGSYVEGFPNALLESCATGTAVLAFKAPGGINEIVRNGINGAVANNEEEFLKLLEEMREMVPSPTQVRQTVVPKYSETLILRKYENLFLQVVNRTSVPKYIHSL